MGWGVMGVFCVQPPHRHKPCVGTIIFFQIPHMADTYSAHHDGLSNTQVRAHVPLNQELKPFSAMYRLQLPSETTPCVQR